MNRDDPSILVVDDEVDTCKNLADIFTDLGYRVDTAHDGWAALELVRKTPYDVALLDLKMPGIDGLALYREIKRWRPGTVAIIVTAFAASAIAADAVAAGAMHVLPKPVDVPELLGLMNKALDQPMVLIVDDDEDLCDNLWNLLHEHGYRVCLAYDESNATDRLMGREYDVVLIDMKLPQGDGGRVFHLVREMNPQARTLAITGFRAELDRLVEQVLAEGVDAVCYKPFDVPELLTTIGQLVGKGGKGQEPQAL